MINAHFIAQELSINAHLSAHYLHVIVCIILILFLLSISFTPRHLNLFACGSLYGNIVNKPLEGYRTLVTRKITQTPILQPIHKNGNIELER